MGFIHASLLSFVHFVSGFNARGLNCCCGNHCLCFLPAGCLLLSCDIIEHSATIREVHRFPLVGNEQRRICSPCLSDQTLFSLGRVLLKLFKGLFWRARRAQRVKSCCFSSDLTRSYRPYPEPAAEVSSVPPPACTRRDPHLQHRFLSFSSEGTGLQPHRQSSICP